MRPRSGRIPEKYIACELSSKGSGDLGAGGAAAGFGLPVCDRGRLIRRREQKEQNKDYARVDRQGDRGCPVVPRQPTEVMQAMLQAYVDELLVVGVTRGNVDRLTDGQPMRIQLLKPVKDILVVFGETKPDIIAELEAAGARFEQAHKDAAQRDPL